MVSQVTVYFSPNNARSKIIAQAMAFGIKPIDRLEVRSSLDYKGVDSDVAVFYGMAEGLRQVFYDYIDAGKQAVYVDLGYWDRRLRGRYDGYHKISVNSRHPTAYFQNRYHNDSRLRELGIKVHPDQKGSEFIMIAGMSGKAAEFEGLKPEAYEKFLVQSLISHTRYPLKYRPKPNWFEATALPGSTIQRNIDFPAAFEGCRAVATHHSNVAVDALLWGLPVHSLEGVASVLSAPDLASLGQAEVIDQAIRYQWASDVAWCQFSVDEMKAGLPWRHLKDEGLIP